MTVLARYGRQVNTFTVCFSFRARIDDSNRFCLSSAGIGRTGAIILIDMIIDKIKTYGLQCDIDIFKTVYHLRSQRSGMIQTERQYQFLYTAIKNFIEIYTNKLQQQKRQKQSLSASSSRTPSLQSSSLLSSSDPLTKPQTPRDRGAV